MILFSNQMFLKRLKDAYFHRVVLQVVIYLANIIELDMSSRCQEPQVDEYLRWQICPEVALLRWTTDFLLWNNETGTIGRAGSTWAQNVKIYLYLLHLLSQENQEELAWMYTSAANLKAGYWVSKQKSWLQLPSFWMHWWRKPPLSRLTHYSYSRSTGEDFF